MMTLVALVSWLSSSAAFAAVDTGRTVEAIAVQGVVECRAVSAKAWKPVVLGQHLPGATALRTGAEGRVRLRTADGSLLLVDPNTMMTIESLRADESGQEGLRARIRMWAGMMWANVTHLAKPADVRITTSSCVIGVRGTNFSVASESESATNVSCSEGTVYVDRTASGGTPAPTEAAAETEVPAGYTAEVTHQSALVRVMTSIERDRVLSVWDIFPDVRKKIAASLKEVTDRLGAAGDQIDQGASAAKEAVLGTDQKALSAGRRIRNSVVGAVRGLVTPPTPESESGTAQPAPDPTPAEKH